MQKGVLETPRSPVFYFVVSITIVCLKQPVQDGTMAPLLHLTSSNKNYKGGMGNELCPTSKLAVEVV